MQLTNLGQVDGWVVADTGLPMYLLGGRVTFRKASQLFTNEADEANVSSLLGHDVRSAPKAISMVVCHFVARSALKTETYRRGAVSANGKCPSNSLLRLKGCFWWKYCLDKDSEIIHQPLCRQNTL
jgi:hypothetical protein